jgi:thiamine phosphate synthase YjbQ (UPF0047 family)
MAAGVLTVFVRPPSGSLVIMENAGPSGRRDMDIED